MASEVLKKGKCRVCKHDWGDIPWFRQTPVKYGIPSGCYNCGYCAWERE